MSGSAVILGAYLIYVAAAMGLAMVRPPRQAALIAYCGGWLLLPVAAYDPATITAQGFTLNVIGTALPSTLLLTKALVIPLGILAGLAWRARALFAGFQFAAADGAMAAFCLSPCLAAIAGRTGAEQALIQAAYLTGLWGGSWLIGRLLLSDSQGRNALIEAMAVSGLCLLPFALIEGLDGPRFYTLLYGGHPFYTDGAERYVGARPLLLFEHGNQYGMWMAMSALAAFHLAFSPETRSRGAIAAAVLLAACAMASQSVGAVLLYLLGTAWLLMSRRIRRVTLLAGALLLSLVGGAYLSGGVPIERLAYQTPVGQAAVAMLKKTGRGSLGWRVHRDIVSLGTIRRAALTGYGRWDWWRPLGSHPWGFTLLLAGQFGLLSLALLAFALLAAPVRDLWLGSAGVLPILVLLSAADAQLNSFLYFNAILAAAALASRRSIRHSAASTDSHSPLSTRSQHAH